jgi:hypothetical protein
MADTSFLWPVSSAMLRQAKAVVLTIFAVAFSLSGYFVLRADCFSYLVIRPCEQVGVVIGLSLWAASLVMLIIAKKMENNPDTDLKLGDPSSQDAAQNEAKVSRKLVVQGKYKPFLGLFSSRQGPVWMLG